MNFNKVLKMVDVFPGQKRTVISLFIVGMGICQSLATYVGPEWGHMFSAAEWGSVVSLFAVAYQLKLIREEEKEEEKNKE